MAKESGIGWTTLSCDDSGGTLRAIINDVSNIQYAMPRAVQDVTGMDKSAIERLLLLADFSGTLNAPAFNDTTSTGFHQVFKTVPLQASANRTLTLSVSGQTISNEVLATDYAMTRGADGSLTSSVPFVLADGTVPTWS